MTKALPQTRLSLLLIFILVAVAQLATAQTKKISIADGSWHDPLVWDPVGVPFNEDTIIVNTHITFNSVVIQNMTKFFQVNAGKTLTGNASPDSLTIGSWTFRNYGEISADFIAEGTNDSSINRGLITCTGTMSQSGDFTNDINGSMNIQGDFNQSGIFINENIIVITGNLATSDNLFNHGDISTGSWTNGGVVTGNGGRFCISGNFVNSDSIYGQLDICDSSPGGFGDINVGYIDPAITNCQNGPCAVITGVDAEKEEVGIIVYPNPASDHITIETGTDLEIILMDARGVLVMQMEISPREKVYVGNLPTGLYLYRLSSKFGMLDSGKLIIDR